MGAGLHGSGSRYEIFVLASVIGTLGLVYCNRIAESPMWRDNSVFICIMYNCKVMGNHLEMSQIAIFCIFPGG